MGPVSCHSGLRSLPYSTFTIFKKLDKTSRINMKSCLILLASIATIALAEPEVRPSGLKVVYTLVPETCEKKAMNGQMLTMRYTGTLEDGTKFDSSVDRNEPFKFQIGVGQVIKGWEEGVLGMCIGEKRTLIVPPELGYGDQGAGEVIPGGATLNFDIELLETEEGPQPVNVFKQIDMDNDAALSREELSVYLNSRLKPWPAQVANRHSKLKRCSRIKINSSRRSLVMKIRIKMVISRMKNFLGLNTTSCNPH